MVGVDHEEPEMLEVEAEPEGELFSLECLEDDGVPTLLHGRYICVDSGSGLADPEKDRTLLVTCEPGKVETIPHKEGGKVVRYTTVKVYTPVYVENVQRGDAGRVEAIFAQLVKDDPKAAARALDAMRGRAGLELLGL